MNLFRDGRNKNLERLFHKRNKDNKTKKAVKPLTYLIIYASANVCIKDDNSVENTVT